TDRYNRYNILLITQVLAMLQAAALAYCVLSGNYSINLIIVLSLALGIINAFDTPSRQALMVELVNNKEDLPNAIALNSSMVHSAWLIGPSIAGLIMLEMGEGFCFLIDAISFVAVITSLLMIKMPPRQKKVSQTNAWG